MIDLEKLMEMRNAGALYGAAVAAGLGSELLASFSVDPSGNLDAVIDAMRAKKMPCFRDAMPSAEAMAQATDLEMAVFCLAALESYESLRRFLDWEKAYR